MKNVLIQSGKAFCYFLLFLGMQVIVNFVFQFIYGFKLGLEMAASGKGMDVQFVTDKLMEFILDNTNWIVLISGLLTLVVLWVFFKIRKKKLHQEAGIHKFDRKFILPLIGLGIALSFFVSSVLTLLPIPESIMEDYLTESSVLENGGVILRILSIVIMAPVVEEVVFRGLILSRLKKAMDCRIAILISSLLFGIIHGQVLWMAYAFVLGIVLALVAERTKSTGAAIALHLLFNLMGIFGEFFYFSLTQTIIVGVISAIMIVCFGYYMLKAKKVQVV